MFPSLKDLKNKPAVHWENLSKIQVLNLISFVQKNVPAYNKFISTFGIRKKISTINDFRILPVSDKETYLRKYPYKELFPKNKLGLFTTVSATSGSSGEEFYFPREEIHDEQYKYAAEIFLKNQFGINNKTKTLGIIGFGMGIWIGGIFTYKNFNRLSQDNNLTLIPAGSNIETFLKAFKKLAPFYDQVILMGYPPFIKDVLDEGQYYNIEWKKHRIKILTAAEGYSEKFRDYITKVAGLKNPLLDTINIYGTVELGTMGSETPLSILIRRLAVNDDKVFNRIFKKANRLPTLVQYHPYQIYFEEIDGEVVASGYGSSIPLIRYRFPDMGGVISFDEMINHFNSLGIDLYKEAKKLQIESRILKLPFVYVYDRSDHAIILRGANIYPDEIKLALHHHDLSRYLTGRFTMIKKEDAKMNEYLEINVELKKNIKESSKIVKLTTETIVQELLRTNQEFSYLHSQNNLSVQPRVVLWSYKYDLFFKQSGKQLWSIKKQ